MDDDADGNREDDDNDNDDDKDVVDGHSEWLRDCDRALGIRVDGNSADRRLELVLVCGTCDCDWTILVLWSRNELCWRLLVEVVTIVGVIVGVRVALVMILVVVLVILETV